MSNEIKTQPSCPCASGDVNHGNDGLSYCPWCDHDYGPWHMENLPDSHGIVGEWCVLDVEIDYDDLSLSSYEGGNEDAAFEMHLFGDC